MAKKCSICGKGISPFYGEVAYYDYPRLPKSVLCQDCDRLLTTVKSRDMSKEAGVAKFSEAVESLKRKTTEGSSDEDVKSEVLALADSLTFGYPTYIDYVNSAIAEHFPEEDSHNLGGYLFVNQRTRQFSVATDEGIPGDIRGFDDLIDYNVSEDGKTITNSGAGAAAVGALLAGAAGAIVGSSMNRQSEQIVSQLDIVLSYKGLDAPMETIRLLRGPVEKGSDLYSEKVQLCNQIVSALKQIMGSGQEPNMKTERGARAIYAFSVADEILKFKHLADEGIITSEEFKSQKRKLLSLDY